MDISLRISLLCSFTKIKSYWFHTAWGCVNNEITFGRNVSFNEQHSYLAVFWVVERMHILCSVCVCLSVGEWKVWLLTLGSAWFSKIAWTAFSITTLFFSLLLSLGFLPLLLSPHVMQSSSRLTGLYNRKPKEVKLALNVYVNSIWGDSLMSLL